MTLKYFSTILFFIAFISGCHIFLPSKGMAQSITLHLIQVLIPLWAASRMLKLNKTVANIFLLSSLGLIALTDLNYFITMYAMKLDPKNVIIDLMTTLPYHISYVLGGIGLILKFSDKHALVKDKKFWIILASGVLIAIPFVIIPSVRTFNPSPSGMRSFYLSLSAILSSLFLFQVSLYGFIASRTISHSLFSLGFFSFAITDWAIQIETLNRTQAVLSFNAFLWTLSGVIISLPVIFERVTLERFEVYSPKSLISTMRLRLVLALTMPLLFLGVTLNNSWYGVVTVSFGLIFGCITITFAVQYLYDSVLDLSRVLKLSTSKNFTSAEIDDHLINTPLEMREALFDVMYERILLDRKESELEVEMARKLHLMTTQVAHDIRSPLSTLEYALSQGGGNNEIISKALNSIRQVAEDLLINERDPNKSLEPELFLVPTLKHLIDEKNYLLRSSRVHLEGELDNHKIVACQEALLVRVFSNLINNSIEASDSKGKISLNVSFNSSEVILTLTDNGPGFPKKLLEGPIERGQSEKKGGYGLGLSFAFETLCTWGGSLELSNSQNGGAVVTMSLPLLKNPRILVDSVNINFQKKVIVLDDDHWVVKEWENIFGSHGITIESFTNPKEFQERASLIPFQELHEVLFLVDHDLNCKDFSGMEVIANLNIKANAILVTSRASDPEIIRESARLGIRLYPKDLLKVFPLNFTKNTGEGRIVVIDDETLVRRIWRDESLGRKISCLTFSTIDSVEKDLKSFSKNDFFLIDSQLGNGIRGELFMEKLIGEGFTKTFAMTGKDAQEFTHIKGLRDVLPKNPQYFFEKHFIH